MNVYMILEDGETRIYAAPSFAAAIEAAWLAALRDETERRGHDLTDPEALEERAEWEAGVLESVTFVGELENFDDVLLQRSATAKEPDLDNPT